MEKGHLVLDEQAFMDSNIFKFEQRLQSSVSRYIDAGSILTTYYHLHEDATTVDRGFQDIEKLFGTNSPLRFDQINNFPLAGFGQLLPNNNDDLQIEDISAEGETIVLPKTIVPHPNDFFTINHLTMKAIFQVIEVQYDSMRTEGYYKLRYRLHSTSLETLENLKKQVVAEYNCHLKEVGSDINPIISLEDSVKRTKLEQMLIQMIEDYRAIFYNERHNCYLLPHKGERWFDLCLHEFIKRHSIFNVPDTSNVVVVTEKLYEPKMPFYYQRSIYRWIEDDAPIRNLTKFPIETVDNRLYHVSSFNRWHETDIKIALPFVKGEYPDSTFTLFDTDQINFFTEEKAISGNEYDVLLRKFIRGELHSIGDISLNTGNILEAAISDYHAFYMTPIIIYIIRKVLQFN